MEGHMKKKTNEINKDTKGKINLEEEKTKINKKEEWRDKIEE
jgi:hypothetical protein